MTHSTLSIFIVPATPIAHMPAVHCMTHHQAEQDFPNMNQVSLHTSNKIYLPVLQEVLSHSLYCLNRMDYRTFNTSNNIS
jgi:hypothetical protein